MNKNYKCPTLGCVGILKARQMDDGTETGKKLYSCVECGKDWDRAGKKWTEYR